MTDETEELDENEVEVSLDDMLECEVFDWCPLNGQGGKILFPHGVSRFARDSGIALVRISDHTGDVEYLEKLGSRWKKVTTAPSTSLHGVEASTDS